MNLSESVKHVLKSRGHNLFGEFLKQDLHLILKDYKEQLHSARTSGLEKLKNLRNQKISTTLGEIKDSAIDSFVVLKVMPRRLKQGFGYFQQDFLSEMEKLPDQKQKTLFCLKIMGGLGGSTMSAFYGVRQGKSDVRFSGLRIRNAFTQYLITEMVFKLFQVFILRFIQEVDKGLTDPQDKQHLKFFKELLSNNKAIPEGELPADVTPEPGDKALEIVEALKNYILTGKKA